MGGPPHDARDARGAPGTVPPARPAVTPDQPEGSTPAGGEPDELAYAAAALAQARAELEDEWRRRLETQTLFDLVLDAMPDAVVLVDGRGRISHVNQAATSLAGRTAAELLGHPAQELFGPRAPRDPLQLFEHAPGGRFTFETAIVAGDRRVPLTVSCSLLRETTGRVVGAAYAARDLSETRQLVARLEQAEARWRLVAQLGDLLGRQLDPRESLDETCRWLSRSTGAGVAVVLAPALTVERVVTWPAEGPVATRLGDLVGSRLEPGSALSTAVHGSQTVHVSTVPPNLPVFDRAGDLDGVASVAVVPLVARNLSLGALVVYSSEPEGVRQRALVEQAAARVALALANANLRDALSRFEADEEAARFREELLAAVSHDMQTPLAVLLGSVRALQAGDDLSPRERSHLYERMGRRGLQLRRLVQQFLDYSRLGAGRPIVVRPVMADIRFALTQLEADIAGRRPVTVTVPPDLPPAYVDPDRLDQVMANLISNALKFSPPGSPIAVEARATDDAVELVVTDRGQGMSPADLASLFRKFHRGSGTEDIPGTGLGLYVSKAVLEAQDAHLLAASEPGKGSRFTVVLPRRPPGERARDAPAGPRRR